MPATSSMSTSAVPTSAVSTSAVSTSAVSTSAVSTSAVSTSASGSATPERRRYLAPDAASRRILNPLMTRLVRLGVGLRGGRILHVRGRTSGEWRTVPVNPLTLGAHRYLVAPRGHTEWVRNLRVAGTGRLQLGRTFEEFTARELDDAEKPPVIRAYLEHWAMETQRFFGDLRADSSDAEIAALAPDFPVFRIEPADG